MPLALSFPNETEQLVLGDTAEQWTWAVRGRAAVVGGIEDPNRSGELSGRVLS